MKAAVEDSSGHQASIESEMRGWTGSNNTDALFGDDTLISPLDPHIRHQQQMGITFQTYAELEIFLLLLQTLTQPIISTGGNRCWGCANTEALLGYEVVMMEVVLSSHHFALLGMYIPGAFLSGSIHGYWRGGYSFPFLFPCLVSVPTYFMYMLMYFLF